MYEFDSRVRYSEVNSKGQLTWLALMDYFQDCSVFHSEQVHLSVDYLAKRQIAWFLSSWQICVNSMPHLADKITIQTWSYGMKGFYGYRNFLLNDQAGERLAYANSVWVLVDTTTGRPVRVPQEVADCYGVEPQLPMECSPRKLAMPDACDIRESITVPSFFIDTNQHMNNSCYIQVALGFLPEDFKTDETRVEYRRAAVQGDVLIPRVSIEKKRVVVALCAEDEKPYAVVEFLQK